MTKEKAMENLEDLFDDLDWRGVLLPSEFDLAAASLAVLRDVLMEGKS